MDDSYKRLYYPTLFLLVFVLTVQACKNKPNKETKIVTSTSQLNGGVSVQLEEILNALGDSAKMAKASTKLYNPYSVKAYYAKNDFEPIWTSDGKFTIAGEAFKKFIEKDCKYFGLFPKAYHATKLAKLYTDLQKDSTSKLNAEEWAKAESFLTDAFFQTIKHVKNGRLYNDTNYKFFDTTLTANAFIPTLKSYLKAPTTLPELLKPFEPNFLDYDSLKMALKPLVDQNADGKTYSVVAFPFADSLKFVKSLVNRIKEEGLAQTIGEKIDSLALAKAITEYQTKYAITTTGKYSKELIANMNTKSDEKFAKVALSLDKFKEIKIKHNGAYVLVNIPSYYLRAYHPDSLAVESKIAVGKTSTKTPVMESEISDIVIMPNWYVPPSILKIPGYIERHRGRANFIVRGNTVIQKGGEGNALGLMKFNFKSGDAIYLHDTNERGVFGSSYRAVSHGCVRVQKYVALASFISSVSPISEKDYKKVVDRMKIDSIKGDTSYKYKYVVTDSVGYNTDTIPGMVKRRVHKDLIVEKKVPVYIKYFTCAARNGAIVLYNDIYGIDRALMSKYFSDYL
jgi:L,D-transpeptidase YcbB